METNNRGFAQQSFDGEHLSLEELKRKNVNNGYIFNNIPAYPRPEIHVAHLSHSTRPEAVQGIRNDGGFKDPYSSNPEVVWFSLTVTPDDLRDAETRTMKIIHPEGREEDFTPAAPTQGGAEEVIAQRGFLQKFASSPAFMSSSRYGSYRFTFRLQDVLDRYSEQFCGGESPVMRVWRTVLYKQEVMYAVLVHSPTNQERFKKFPLLQEEPDSICAFREEPEPHFIWKPQAMSGTHRFTLNVRREEGTLWVSQLPQDRWYLWDHVALALHLDDEEHEKVLKFENLDLRQNLRFCEEGNPIVVEQSDFKSYTSALSEVTDLWPDYEGPLETFAESSFAVHP